MLRYKSVLLTKSLLGKVINMTESLKVSNSGISDEFKGLEEFRRKIQKKERMIYLSVRQVAEILNISARSVNRQIKRGLLPASKVGGRVRVYCDDVYLFAKRMRIVRKEKL